MPTAKFDVVFGVCKGASRKVEGWGRPGAREEKWEKIVWSILSCLMVAVLVLASCAPAVTEKQDAAPAAEEEEEVWWPEVK